MAYESLAVISCALSKLNCGQLGVCRLNYLHLCPIVYIMVHAYIIRFGVNVEVLHCLERPFSATSGGFILQQLVFNQARTNFVEVHI